MSSNSKIKIAIVYHYLAHYRLPIFQELMKSKNIEYHIYSGLTSEIEIKQIDINYQNVPIKDGGLKWYSLDNFWFFKKKFLIQKGLVDIIHKNEYDGYIFLGNPFHLTTWIGAVLSKLRNRKVYFWMHGFYRNKLSFFDFIKLYLFYKIPHGFFLYGNNSFNRLLDLKIKDASRMHVIYNSLDYYKSREQRKVITPKELLDFRGRFFQNTKLPIIVFIGRINKIKKVDYLLEAQKQLKDKHNHDIFNLLIIGNGQELSKLKDMAIRFGINNNVHFIGESYDEVKNGELLMYSDLCVTPGEVGLTAMHSLSYGTPVISHNNLEIQMPESEAIIPGVTGELYKYNSIVDLIITIESWFNKFPMKSEEITRNCFNIIDTYYNPKYQASIFNKVLSE